MAKVSYVAELDLAGCTGCKWCEIVCPSGAIAMAERKAVINAGRCIGCAQ